MNWHHTLFVIIECTGAILALVFFIVIAVAIAVALSHGDDDIDPADG